MRLCGKLVNSIDLLHDFNSVCINNKKIYSRQKTRTHKTKQSTKLSIEYKKHCATEAHLYVPFEVLYKIINIVEHNDAQTYKQIDFSLSHCEFRVCVRAHETYIQIKN